MAKRTIPQWLPEAVFYQIYVQSFCDSNGDGIGDLKGIIGKLDYIKSVGVDAIWLNPCFKSAFQDGGYDISDFYKVDPRYGTNADLKRLFKEAHKRGMRVILDLVAGHTSAEHPWFKESCKHHRNKYTDWYIWTPCVWDGGDGSVRLINGYAERNGNFATNFFYCQPALNYGFAKPNPECPWQQPVDAPGPQAVRAELKKIMTYWLDMGADGFRVDMAASLIKGDSGEKEVSKLWKEIRTWFEGDYPEAILVSEWGNPQVSINAGFHIDFMLHFGVAGYPQMFLSGWEGNEQPCFFDKQGQGDVTLWLEKYMMHYAKTRRKGYITLPTANHDFQRLNRNRNRKELETAYVFFMTMPGLPFIYFGDEIGMRFVEGLKNKEGGYTRVGTRTPMQWNKKKNAGFSTAASKDLYLPLDDKKDRPDVDSQESDPKSLLNFVRELIQIRKDNPVLSSAAEFEPLYAKKDKYPFVFLRKKGKQRAIVAVNPSKEAAVAKFKLDAKATGLEPIIAKNASIEIKGNSVTVDMKGISYGVWLVK